MKWLFAILQSGLLLNWMKSNRSGSHWKNKKALRSLWPQSKWMFSRGTQGSLLAARRSCGNGKPISRAVKVASAPAGWCPVHLTKPCTAEDFCYFEINSSIMPLFINRDQIFAHQVHLLEHKLRVSRLFYSTVRLYLNKNSLALLWDHFIRFSQKNKCYG